MGSGVSNRKNKTEERDILTQTAPPRNAESKHDGSGNPEQRDVKGIQQIDNKSAKQTGKDLPPPTCTDDDEYGLPRVAASKKGAGAGAGEGGSSSGTRHNSNSNSSVAESGAPTRATTIAYEEEELENIDNYSPRSECSSRRSYGAIDRDNCGADHGDHGPYDSNADKFSYTALSLGMDNEELLFNMMFFGEQGTGAGVDMANFGLMLDSAQQETVALHSENNTPYKLRPADEGTISALQVEIFGGGGNQGQGTATTCNAADEDQEHECRICWDELEVGCDIIRLPKCGHFFHSECLVRWIKLQAFCPVCRATIDTAVEDTDRERAESLNAVAQADDDGDACGYYIDTTADKKVEAEEENIRLFGNKSDLNCDEEGASPNSNATEEVMRRLRFDDGDGGGDYDDDKKDKKRGDNNAAAAAAVMTTGPEVKYTNEESKEECCDDRYTASSSIDSPNCDAKEHQLSEKLPCRFSEVSPESGNQTVAARVYVESSISEALNKVHCHE